jgi:DNA-binding FadR family transcriptional regulator
MRKPISKHALRRALDRVEADGHVKLTEPAGTVVDRLWHEIEKSNYKEGRKKPVSRHSLRTAKAPELVDDEVVS